MLLTSDEVLQATIREHPGRHYDPNMSDIFFRVTGDLDLLSISDLPFADGIVTPADYLATKNRDR